MSKKNKRPERIPMSEAEKKAAQEEAKKIMAQSKVEEPKPSEEETNELKAAFHEAAHAIYYAKAGFKVKYITTQEKLETSEVALLEAHGGTVDDVGGCTALEDKDTGVPIPRAMSIKILVAGGCAEAAFCNIKNGHGAYIDINMLMSQGVSIKEIQHYVSIVRAEMEFDYSLRTAIKTVAHGLLEKKTLTGKEVFDLLKKAI